MMLAEHFDRGTAHARALPWYTKAAAQSLEGNDLETAKESLPLALQAIGKAASKGVIHHNTAARYASRVTLAFNKKANPAPAKV